MSAGPAYILGRMTWPEVETALQTVRLAIIPTGACEQHGPNMTLETDTAICTAIAERLAQRLYPRALLAPSMPYGVSPHHMRFPGTITMSPETFNAVLWDTVRSLKQHGIEHFLFVNGHGGNMDSLNVMTLRMRHELSVQAVVMFYLRLAADVVRDGAQSTLYGHACEVEVSVGMYTAPHIVRADLQPGELRPYAHAHTDIKAPYRIDYPFLFDEFTVNGALGDARLATEEFGREIVETALERSLAFLESFLPAE
jgi:creatinine amidohydrolase